MLLQLLCNHVAVVIGFFFQNVALRVDRNNHCTNGMQFHFVMIQISEKYTSKKEIMLSTQFVFI